MDKYQRESMKSLIDALIKDEFRYSFYRDENGVEDCHTLERYVDYRDEFPESTIRKILDSSHPYETFSEEVFEWDMNCDDWYYQDEFKRKLSEICENTGIDEWDAWEYINENYQWTYPSSFLNPTVRVCIEVDAGDGNYDFTLHNLLNYASGYGYVHKLENKSGLGWLARQQGKFTELSTAIRKAQNGKYNEEEYSKFTQSAITELQNACTHMTSLVFVLEMDLEQAMKIKENRNALNGKFDEYNPLDSDIGGYITLGKNTMCGLFDCWSGSGSMLEIELEKDVKLPYRLINTIYPAEGKSDRGYTVDSVYGLVSDCFRPTLKEIA